MGLFLLAGNFLSPTPLIWGKFKHILAAYTKEITD